MGGTVGIVGRAVAQEVMGVGGRGSKRGCLEAAKRRDNQGLSLTPLRPGG